MWRRGQNTGWVSVLNWDETKKMPTFFSSPVPRIGSVVIYFKKYFALGPQDRYYHKPRSHFFLISSLHRKYVLLIVIMSAHLILAVFQTIYS